MMQALKGKDRGVVYALFGFILGIGAPVVWLLLHLIFFPDPEQTLFGQIVADITQDSYHTLLYLYMGGGTALVMAFFGHLIGKATNALHERAFELDTLHREVASQKEIFENRYKVLDNNIKNFHQISSRIQNSVDVNEVLTLCAEGLHDILGYERVNILLADDERKSLRFVAVTRDEGYDTRGIILPLDSRSGAVYKCFADKKLYLIEDITKYPAEFHIQPPFDVIKPLRSKSFVLCPIVVKGESMGVFGIDNKYSHRALNDTDVDTIKLFADQAASAIIKINLLKAIDRLTSDLEGNFTAFLEKRGIYSRNVYSLKVAMESVASGTAHIASAAESVLASVDETSSSVGEISVAIDQVTRNLDYLSESIDKSAVTMEEINASIKNVERNAAVSHDVSSQVKAHADKGRAAVEETIAALDTIQGSVQQSYDVVQQLCIRSGRIDNIVNVINDITKRTNLLALNASIIAAQAGEYGKSFGVVADEIRNLSQQTSHSTGEITGIIEEILSESKLAAQNITSTKELVQQGVEHGKGMGKTLKLIVDSSVRSMNITEEIKTATEEQAKSVQLVTHTIEDVSTMSSQIFNASKEQSKATKNIVQSVDSIKEMTEEMVKVTSRQMDDRTEIKKAVETVSGMVEKIFDDMEQRRAANNVVVKNLELVKKIAG